MAKRVNERATYSVELHGRPVYDNRAKYSDSNDSNQRSQSVYFEFQAMDQDYSYALETDWHGHGSEGSDGTVSTYADGRVGPLKSHSTPNDSHISTKEQRHILTTKQKQLPATEQRHVPVTERKQVPATEQRHVSVTERKMVPVTKQRHESIRERKQLPVTEQRHVPVTELKQVPATEQTHVPVTERGQVPATGQIVSEHGLRESIQSNGTTYDQINEIDITVHVGRRINQNGSTNTHAHTCAVGRILLALVIVVILLGVGGLVYVFVINKTNGAQSPDCDTLPQVPNGQPSESGSDQGYTTATIRCSHGYELHGNETMTCTEGRWSKKPSCERIKCGPYPKIENGVINGTETVFESNANVICDHGFLIEESNTITCLGDGTWSSHSGCHEHPCGIYTPSGDMKVADALILSDMTLCLKCKFGLKFVDDSSNCVTCQNGKWIGSPKCEIPGMVYFDTPNPVYHVNDRVSLRCVVQGSQELNSIMMARTDFKGSNTEPLLLLNRTSDKIQSFGDTDRFSVSHESRSDGVVVALEIADALCEDRGVYICGNVVGAVDSPDKVKSTNTSVRIIDVTSSVPELVVSDTMYVGIADDIKCIGEIGLDENGTASGEIVLQIKYKNEDSFKNLSSVIKESFSQNSNCRFNETIVSSLRPENDMHNASVRCILLTTDGIQLTSTEEKLKIISPNVNISALPSVFTFGEAATITSVLDNIDGWNLIEVRKKCIDSEEYIVRIASDAQDAPILTEGHIVLTKNDVTPKSAMIKLKYDSVNCSDSCGNAENTVEYVAAVRINNDTWIEKGIKMKFQKQPAIPILTVPKDTISGNTAWFDCTGEIGEPKGYLEIESIFEETNFTVFLSSKEGKDSNALGSITSVTDVSKDCGNIRTIAFRINSLTPKFHQKMMRCVSRHSESLANGKSAISHVQAIEVIPENFCSKPDGYTGARTHPFYCNMFVTCHNGHVTGVPAGCSEDRCFQDTCYSCDDIGGCSITDIYVDTFSEWVQLGESVTLICKVKDFQDLSDIMIYKNDNNTAISSILEKGLETDVAKVQDGSYISGNKGQLMINIASVQCKDEGAYRCVPEGSGKYSEDETYLDVRDADGNTVC